MRLEAEVRLPGPAEVVGVVGEAWAPLGGAAGESTIVDEDETVTDRSGVVCIRVDLVDLERTDYGRVSGNAVKTEIRLTVGDVSEEIRVRAVTRE